MGIFVIEKTRKRDTKTAFKTHICRKHQDFKESFKEETMYSFDRHVLVPMSLSVWVLSKNIKILKTDTNTLAI